MPAAIPGARPSTISRADDAGGGVEVKLLVLVLVVVLALLQYRLWFAGGGRPEVWELERAIQAQLAENDKLEERNRSLEAEVLDLKEGLEAVEERARSEMGMIKAGETFYQVIGQPVRTVSPGTLE